MPGHSCERCISCFDKDEIARKFVTDGMLEKARVSYIEEILSARQERIVKIGMFTLNGWRGCLPFYLFHCSSCGKDNVDYAHGYTSNGLSGGLLYLSCSDCRLNLILYRKRFYTDNDIIKEGPFSRIKKFFSKKVSHSH